MVDTTSQKIEPVIVSKPSQQDAPSVATSPGDVGPRNVAEQLARIEEKAARIEDKYARSESLLLRVQATFEDAMAEFGNLARRSDVATVEQRVGRLPGAGALFVMGIITAIITTALIFAVSKYGIPGVLPPGSLLAPAPVPIR